MSKDKFLNRKRGGFQVYDVPNRPRERRQLITTRAELSLRLYDGRRGDAFVIDCRERLRETARIECESCDRQCKGLRNECPGWKESA